MACIDFRAKARHTITIQEKSLVVDAVGGQTNTWVTQSTVKAQIEPTTGREVFTASSISSEVTHKMTIRYQSALKSTKTATPLRVLFDDRFFAVDYIKNFASDMKNEGRILQTLFVVENKQEYS